MLTTTHNYLLFCRIQRYCSKTVTIGNVTIPKGTGIEFPIILIHHSPKYWPDPYKFDPERYGESDITHHFLNSNLRGPALQIMLAEGFSYPGLPTMYIIGGDFKKLHSSKQRFFHSYKQKFPLSCWTRFNSSYCKLA